MGRRAAAALAGALGLALVVACAPGRAEEPTGLAVSLAADKGIYAPGEPIEITFGLAHRGAAPVTLRFATAQRFDLAIAPEGGAEVWRWSAGRMFAQVLGEKTLNAERPHVTYAATFGGTLGPGRYRVEAWLTDGSGAFTASLAVEVR